MKFISTTSAKVSSIPVQVGQLIFSTDDRVIYLDSSSDNRTTFQQIITLVTEEQRLTGTNFVNGYYFVEETTILWRYNDSIWTQLTNSPEEKIIFIDEVNLPKVGREKTLYITEKALYKWRKLQQDYTSIGNPELKPIEL